MKTGIILFIIGLTLITFLTNKKFNKDIIKNIAVFVAFLVTVYGVILMVQPNEDKYFDYTHTTIVKEDKKLNK